MKKKTEKKFNNDYVKSCDDNGELHSVNDEPTIVIPGQAKFWHKHGKLHRDGNKPAAEFANGAIEFWIDGQQVRRLEKNEAVFYYWEE